MAYRPSSDLNDDSDIPRLARRCLEQAQAAEQVNREAMRLRLKMYIGDQWDEREKERRTAKSRPFLVVNKCKPPVDQIENEIRVNTPGPICHPVGDGAKDETADVIAGMIRKIEYASNASTAYTTAGKYSAASGYGVIEYGTRYVSDRGFDQELFVSEVEDPSTVWFDPLARRANREDAMWALKGPKIIDADSYKEQYGTTRKVLNRNYLQSLSGSIQNMFGWSGDYSSINTWTSGGKGPYWVAEYWRVSIELEKLRMYTDNVARFDYEIKDRPLPPDVEVKADDDGDDSDYIRDVPTRKVTKYIIDACEVLDTVEWIGDHIPLIAILGPEIYIDGKLHRLSLVHGMIDAQRAFNYVATSMTEIAGKVPRAPWVGTKGQFIDEKWETASTEDWAYLEVEPVEIPNELTGGTTLAPMPQRNMMEASIQWLIQLGAFFNDCIQAASATFDASLGKTKGDQSGRAIQALQQESSQGNYNYPDGLNKGIGIMYQQWLEIMPLIYDSASAQTIVKADGQHEQVLINQLFDHPDGKMGEDGKKKQASHDIKLGQYSVRVQAGPSFQTRNDAALENLANLFKGAPALLTIPGVAAAYARMLGEGNPKVDQIADMLPGGEQSDESPEQTQQKNQALTAQVQQLQQGLQQMHQAIQAQLPKIEADKFKALLDSLTKIEVAHITASKDFDTANADREADTLSKMLGFAHDTASQAVDHEHQAGMAADAQAAAAQSQQSAQDAAVPQ